MDLPKPYQTIRDFVTGKVVPDVGAEANRQAVERLLVLEKGYDRKDIEVDADISFSVAGERYSSQVDLIVSVGGRLERVMVIKCVAGSLGSCEREALASARIVDPRCQIPLAVVTDGTSALVLDSESGKKIGEGLSAIPDKTAAAKLMATLVRRPLSSGRIERERLIFRTYNCAYVNIARRLPPRS